jgi:TolB-like protein/DNA-binding winged helix-turn-helix (wHTH) protein
MNRVDSHLYEFGPFVLDAGERLLCHGTAQADLPPRAFDTLLALVKSEGRLLEKDALMRTVWGETVVEESNLTQVIYLLRKTLREGDGGVRYIETVPKRGYRFVAKVREVEAVGSNGNGHGGTTSSSVARGSSNGSDAAPSATSAAVQSQSRQAHKEEIIPWPPIRNQQKKTALWPGWLQALIAVLAVLITISILQGMGWKQRLFGAVSQGPIRSIAVLPLQNLSNDPNQEYFADGMTDELITDLAQVRALKVVSKTSIMQYKGTRTPLPAIGKALRVDAVVEGSVLRSGDRVRITAQLIRTSTDRHIWAKAYDGDLKDVLSLQARVAEEITDQVKLNLSPQESGRLHRERSVNPEALELYLRGRYALNQRNPEGLRTAARYFNQAVEKDPNFALAYSGLADSSTLMVLFGEGGAGMGDAKAAAEKALQFDSGLAEAHTSLAAVKILHDWDWQAAEKEFRQAIELNPNFAQAHHWYGNLLLGPEGRHDEAIAELQRARELDPLSLIVRADMGYAYFLAGQYDLALQQYQQVLASNPNFLPVHFYLSQYYRQMGEYDLWLKESVENNNLAGNTQIGQALEQLYAKGGYHAVLEEVANRDWADRVEGGSDSAGGRCSSAQANALLGRNSAAVRMLADCYKLNPDGIIYIKVDPVWAHLRQEPGFQDLLERIHLP